MSEMKRIAKSKFRWVGMSPAYQLLTHTWSSVATATAHSWRRLNRAMQSAMELAIEGGFVFHLKDFEQVYRDFRGNYWFSETVGERFYASAIKAGNLSAVHAYEDWRRRPPFIADDVYNRGQCWKRGRVAVGFQFQWRGKLVEVTSFAADGTYLTACAYEHVDYERKIVRRFRITPADIQVDRKQRKAKQ